MKHVIVLLTLLMLTSCARKVQVEAPAFVRAGNYIYTKDDQGRVFVLTTNGKDFDNAMKTIHPGPSTVNRFDLWVITPAAGQTRKEDKTAAR